ncbi:MAG: hypothetical protein JEZ06_08425 [Anaerolineaceae bacterium]|nr:hypothetical protein [Anaerolineaceae bacterium]
MDRIGNSDRLDYRHMGAGRHKIPKNPAYTVVPIENLPGFPGYRNRKGRSGYDPIDNQLEIAHMEGKFLRNLLTLKLKTSNPFYLCLMILFGGIAFILCLVFFGINQIVLSGNIHYLFNLMILFPVCAFVLGLFLILNFFLNTKWRKKLFRHE